MFIYVYLVVFFVTNSINAMKMKKNAQRDANIAHALAVVRFGHRLPARPPARPLQTGPITIHCAAAS